MEVNIVRREPDHSPMTRRTALALMAAAAAAPAAPARAGAQARLLERRIPRSGEAIPAVGLGTWRTFDVSDSARDRAPLKSVLERFVALGGRVIDSSPMYGMAESVVGDLSTDLGVLDTLFVATKVWMTGRERGIAQMEQSLKQLRRRRVDLMQVHNLVDWQTQLAMVREWKAAGRVRYVGVTHYTTSAYADLERVLRAETLDFVQVNYSLGERDAERRILPLARDRGIAVLINRPFSEGGLFQRVRGQPLPPVAADIDCHTWAQLFLKWILAHPAVTCAIPATSRPDHITDNMTAATGKLPDPKMRDQIAAAVTG
jgi:diketogulonate reductase-like aldo/keto reductase